MEYSIDELRALISQNILVSWAVALGISLVSAGVIKFVFRFISKRLRHFVKNTTSRWDDVLVDILDGLKAWVLFIGFFYVLTKPLNPPEFAQKTLLFLLVVAVTFQLGLWGLYLIKNWRINDLDQRIRQNPSSSAALGLMYTVVQTIFIAVMFLMALSFLGINISALVTGLGVGGIAVALAAQNVLGDLLASLSIVLDKPFVVGEFIVAGDQKGTVEHIGIKTTRLRSIAGEQLILSNKDLLESRIQNYKRMSERRVVQKFGVVYSTPADVLEKIPVWVREFVTANDKLRFDRCHFANYGGSSLDFELVFFVFKSRLQCIYGFAAKIALRNL